MNSQDSLDLAITSELDQTMEINADSAFEQIKKIVQTSVEKHDITIALNAFLQIVEITKISGLALAKGLYELYRHWPEFGIGTEFDEFVDYVYSRIGLHRYTVERYIKVWRLYDEKIIPSEFKDAIQGINIRDQVPIANAIAQGYAISKENWRELAHAPDGATVREVVHTIKQQPNRSSNYYISVDRDGDIWVRQGEGSKMHVGMLDMHDKRDAVQKAIQRIINNTGIIRI